MMCCFAQPPFPARAAPLLTLMVSGALFASVNREPDANFKSNFLLLNFKPQLLFEIRR